MIKYMEVDIKEIDRIKPLWQELINHLKEQTNLYHDEFEAKVFEERIAPYLDKIKDGKSRLIIAIKDNVDIGYSLSSITKDKLGELDSIYVNLEYRGYNIGDYFMKDALEFFEINNTIEDILMVSEGNEDVMKFYNKYGFEMRYYTLRRKK